MHKLLSTIALLGASSLANAADLTINFNDIQMQKGELYVVMYNSEVQFKSAKDAFYENLIKVTHTTHSITVNNVPNGDYAVMVFQDLNNNQKLDTNMLGIPKEPYGFSNNPTLYGPPNYQALKFAMTEQAQTIDIRVE